MNKSQAVRDLLDSDPNLKPTEGVEILKRQGIHINSQTFSSVKTTYLKRKPRRQPAPQPREVSDDSIRVEDLVAVQAMAREFGGTAEARKVLDVLALVS